MELGLLILHQVQQCLARDVTQGYCRDYDITKSEQKPPENPKNWNSSEAVFLPMTLVIRSGGMSTLSLREQVLLILQEFFLGCQYFNLKTTLHFLLVILSCNYENYCN